MTITGPGGVDPTQTGYTATTSGSQITSGGNTVLFPNSSLSPNGGVSLTGSITNTADTGGTNFTGVALTDNGFPSDITYNNGQASVTITDNSGQPQVLNLNLSAQDPPVLPAGLVDDGATPGTSDSFYDYELNNLPDPTTLAAVGKPKPLINTGKITSAQAQNLVDTYTALVPAGDKAKLAQAQAAGQAKAGGGPLAVYQAAMAAAASNGLGVEGQNVIKMQYVKDLIPARNALAAATMNALNNFGINSIQYKSLYADTKAVMGLMRSTYDGLPNPFPPAK